MLLPKIADWEASGKQGRGGQKRPAEVAGAFESAR